MARDEAPGSRLRLDCLPHDLLGKITQQLSWKDRLAFIVSCRAGLAFRKAARQGLWPDLNFKLKKPSEVSKLACWLAANRQHLGSLSLSQLSADDGTHEAQVSQLAMALLGALAGSTVHALEVTVAGDVYVGGWCRLLPQLQSLSIDSTGGALTVATDLRSATRLTSLTLCSSYRRYPAFPPGLPPLLEELTIKCFEAASFTLQPWPQPISAVPQLKKLVLGEPSSDWAEKLPWDGFSGQTALTFLHLTSWPGMARLPEQLSVLTNLRELCIEDCDISSSEEAYQPLTALALLSNLDLAGLGLETVPPSVFSLPALKELNIGWAVYFVELNMADSTSLTHLRMNVETAVASAAHFSRLLALHTLCLDGSEFSETVGFEEVGRLLRTLTKIPSLKVLDLGDLTDEEDAFSKVLQLLAEFGIELPFEITNL